LPWPPILKSELTFRFIIVKFVFGTYRYFPEGSTGMDMARLPAGFGRSGTGVSASVEELILDYVDMYKRQIGILKTRILEIIPTAFR
jgi:hypothetical protein